MQNQSQNICNAGKNIPHLTNDYAVTLFHSVGREGKNLRTCHLLEGRWNNKTHSVLVTLALKV